MGQFAQRRLIRKLELERFIAKVEVHPSPDVNLEQYTIPELTAASILYLAAYSYDDIVGKHVLDLGCGTGRLALGAAYLGANRVVGIDIDKSSAKIAFKNSVALNMNKKVDWINGDLDAVGEKFDTVVQNPPFGVQKRRADRKFLEKALEVGKAVYSLHNHPVKDKRLLSKLKANGGQPLLVEPSLYVQRFVEDRGSFVQAVYALPLFIPKMFDFHTKYRHEIAVDLYVIKRKIR